MSLTRVDLRRAKNSLAELAYREILRGILAHELKPGERLNPVQLAERMGISPTPVKQSIARLAGEGVVELHSGLGPFVVSPTDEDLAHWHDARLMCEVHAVRQGVKNVDEQFLRQLNELAERCRAALQEPDPATQRLEFARADSAFHQQLLALWPNPRIQDWYRQLNVHVRVALAREISGGSVSSRRLDDASRDHQVIARHLAEKNAAACAAVLRRHVRETTAALHRVADSA